MKNLIIVLTLILTLLNEANASSKPKPKPDNKIYGRKGEMVGWVFDTIVCKPVQKIDSFYLLRPTWEQASYFASKRKDAKVYNIVGTSLLTATAVAGYGVYAGAAWLPELGVIKANTLAFGGVAGGVQSLFGNAYGVKWNNDKWVSKSVYDECMKIFGTTQPIWDSLETNFLIIDGPYPTKK